MLVREMVKLTCLRCGSILIKGRMARDYYDIGLT
jgi:RNase P subunit RPR2